MTAWEDDIFGKDVMVNGELIPIRRKRLNIIADGASGEDNPDEDRTDVTIPTGGGGGLSGLGSVDNRAVRTNGTAGNSAQGSLIDMDDSGNIGTPGRVIAGSNTYPTIGSITLSGAPAGALLSVCSSTNALRGQQCIQVNSGAQGARDIKWKARGTIGGSLSPPVDGDGIGRDEFRACDGSNVFQDVGFIDFERADRYGAAGAVTTGLGAVRCLLKSEGPTHSANNLGTSTLATPLSHSFYWNGTRSDDTDSKTLSGPSGSTISVPIIADTTTELRVLVHGVDQTSGDVYWRKIEGLVIHRAGSGNPRELGDPAVDKEFSDDPTWTTTRSINTGSDAFELSIKSDDTNNVKWSVYIWEMAVAFPA